MNIKNASRQKKHIKILKFCIAAGCKIEAVSGGYPDSICLLKCSSVLNPCRMSDIDDLVSDGLIVVSRG